MIGLGGDWTAVTEPQHIRALNKMEISHLQVWVVDLPLDNVEDPLPTVLLLCAPGC